MFFLGRASLWFRLSAVSFWSEKDQKCYASLGRFARVAVNGNSSNSYENKDQCNNP